MGTLEALDDGTLTWFQNHRTLLWDPVMVDITALGGYTVLSLLVFFTVGLLVAIRRYETAGFVLAAVIGGVLLEEAAKHAIGRERPASLQALPAVLQPHSSSFPSGHSMLSAVVYLTLALLLAGRMKGRRARAYLIGCSLLLAFLIGVSRMYLGVHYPTDVMAGWIGGLTWALWWRWVEGHWVRFRERAVDVGGETA